jgi:hypothetical protein
MISSTRQRRTLIGIMRVIAGLSDFLCAGSG